LGLWRVSGSIPVINALTFGDVTITSGRIVGRPNFYPASDIGARTYLKAASQGEINFSDAEALDANLS
jgi:hypothetical protein